MASRSFRSLSLLGFALSLSAMVPLSASAFVVGSSPGSVATDRFSFRVFGSSLTAGNSLMSFLPKVQNVNSTLLSSSTSNISGFPSDATVVAAFLWWTGSTNSEPSVGPTGVDTTADLTLPDGTFINNLAADNCKTVDPSGGFFYCRKDIRSLISGKPINGTYTVGDVIAEPGLFADPQNPNDQNCLNNCQAKYAAWSMVIVFDSPTQVSQRDVILFDGFLAFDENQNGIGIAPPFTMSGFEVGPPGLADFTFFALEGDQQLGVPPQDNPNSPNLFCPECRDFMSISSPSSGGQIDLFDPLNPSGNLFNSTLGGLGKGIDLDRFNIGAGGLGILDVGDTSATVIVGSGDGDLATIRGAGGELVILGWTNLTLTRPSPRFVAPNTSKAVDFTSAGPGSTLTYTLRFSNEGDQPSTNTIVRDTIPAGTTYVPNSTRVNGVPVADVGGTSPLASGGGLNLGTLNPVTQGGTSQVITFQVTINANASGSVTNQANIASTEITTPITTNSVSTTIDAVTIGIPEKRFDDLTAPIGELRPGDIISYTVTVKGSPQTPISGLQFLDDMPPFLRLLSVVPPAGATNNSVLNGGANGTGQVNINNISLPQNGSVNIGITAQVFSEAEFNAAGVATDQIDGQVIANQGKVQAAFLPPNPVCTGDQNSSPQCTDDPTTGVIPDATRFTLTFKPDLSTSAKLVTDENGGLLEPGDTLRYTLRLTNTGNLAANVTITDEMPAGIDGATFTQVTVPAGTTLTFTPPPAGTNTNGRFVATGLSIPAGQTREIVFTVQIQANAANNTAVTNSALVEVASFPNRNVTITSQTLTVVSAPSFDTTTKTVIDQNGGNTRPTDVLEYTITITNTGNRAGTNVVVRDVIDADATVNVASISNGGTFDAATRTITWNLGTVAVDAIVSLTYSTQVNAGLPDGTVISNQAQVNSTELGSVLSDDPTTAAPDDPTVRVITSSPNFEDAAKAALDQNGGAVEPNDVLLYTITTSNQGDTSATGVVITDIVDINLTNVTPQDGGLFNAATRTITWNIPGTVAIGQSITVRFTAQVVTPLANNTEICNQAAVDSTQTAPVNSDDAATADPDDATCVTVSSSPELVFTKAFEDQTGGEIIPGDPIEYTLTIENNGDAPATNVVITDVVDPNIVNIAAQNGGLFNAATNTITWTIAAPIVPGTPLVVTFTGNFRFPLADGTIVCNQGSLATAEIPNTLSDDPATAAVPNDSTCVTVISAPDLGTSIKAFADDNGGDPRPTDVITYTITVKNTGTEDAANITISDPLDANVSFVAGSASDGGLFNAATNTIDWTLPSLAAGAQKAVTFQVTINIPLDNGLEIANQATVDADRISPILTDDAATPPPPNEDDPTIFAVVSSPNFEESTKIVEDINGGLVQPGDTIRYTITVKNTGDMIGRRVTVIDPIDAVNLENIVPGQGGVLNGNQIIWDFNSTPALANVGLSPAGDVVLTFDARIRSTVADGTEILNQATVSHEDPLAQSLTDDPITPEDDDPTIITVGVPNVEEFTKEFTVQGGGAAEPLDIIEYTLTVRNTGTASATGVSVIDPIDTARFEQITPGQGGLLVGNQIRWDATTTPELAVLEADEVVELTFTARIRAGTPDGTEISNQATLSFVELPDIEPSDDPATTDNDDPTIFLVSALPDFEDFTKTVAEDAGGVAPFAPGDAIIYTITLVNNGDGFGRNVVVTDAIAPELENVTPGQGGVFDAATRTVRWDGTTTPELGSVDVGATVTLTISAVIDSPLADETEIANQAQVTDDFISTPELSDDPATLALDDATIFEIVSAARFTGSPKIAEDINGGLVQPGDTIRYTILVTNSGTQSAGGVTFTDAVPGSTTYVANSTSINGISVPDVGGSSPLVAGVLVSSPGQAAGNMLVGEDNAAVVVFEVIVDEGTIEGTLISNQGTINAAGLDPALTDDPEVDGDSDPTQLVVGQAPNLSDAAKSFVITVDNDGDGRADIGDTVAFTISVTNRGSDIASDVEITDAIPTENAQFVPGTLRLNGALLTDVSDADAGEVLNNTVTVRAGDLAIDASATVTFEVTVVAGPAIINQGSVDSVQTAAELTDSDGDDQNGDQETVVPVGDQDQVIVLIDKQTIDQNGGDLTTGDTITYRITVQNVGTLDGVLQSVTDELPDGVTFGEFLLVPDNAVDNFTPPPAGLGQGIAEVTNIEIDAGEEVIIEFTATVSAELGVEICNIAVATINANREPVESDPSCVIVGASPGTGGFAGTLFQDFGVDNLVFDENADRVLPGFEARAFLASDPEGDPVSAAIADADGNYLLLDLPPGDYRVKVFSEEGVFFADAGDASVTDGETTELSVPVDPAGTVYEAETGRAVPNARVFLFFDESDPIDPGEQVPDDELGENQQGQRTGRLGLYTFDAEAGRRYRIEVRTPSPTLLFPSSIIATQEGFATLVQVDENEVSVDDVPNVEDDDAEQYFLQFALGSGGDQIANIKNNHIPLDPLRSVLRLNKKTFDAVARVGETVTFQVTVENRGAQAIAPDAQGRGGLAIQDVLPKGFILLQDSIRLERAAGGLRTREDVPNPATTGRIVSFGGLSIAPSESLILTYQTGIRLDVAPGVYENTAQGFIDVSPATDPDSAKVRVELDPDFAESVVIGKVYCDENKNGQQDTADVGVPYARVYFDTGTYVETDAFGKYHATGFNPGMHLAKIDLNTLPPPGTVTTKASVLFHATSGLLQKVNFGVVCSFEVAGIDKVVHYANGAGAESMPAVDLAEAPANTMVISGDVDDPALFVDNVALTLPKPIVSLGSGIIAIPSANRFFTTSAKLSADGASSWRLRIWAEGTGEILVDQAGDGAPPAELPLELQTIPEGLYRAQLLATSGDAIVGSPVVSMLVTLREGARDVFSIAQTKTGLFSTKTQAPSKTLATALQKSVTAPGANEVLKVEVFVDGSLTGKKALDTTQKRADAIKKQLAKNLSIPETDIWAVGMGSVSKKVNAKDRKVVIRAVPKAPGVAPAEAAKEFEAAPFAYAGKDPVPVLPDGSFARALDKTLQDELVVDIGGLDGRRITALVVIREKAPLDLPEGALVKGDLATREFSVAERPQDLSMLALDLKVNNKGTLKTVKKVTNLTKPLTLTPTVPAGPSVARWKIRIVDELGVDITSLGGEGAPAASLSWDGKDDKGALLVKAGTSYYAILNLETPEGVIAEGMPRRIDITGKTIKYPSMTFKGEGFDSLDKPNKLLKTKLTAAAKQMVKRADQFYLIRVEVPLAETDALAKVKAVSRANAAKDFLVAAGVPAASIRVVGGGSAKYKDKLTKAKLAALNMVSIQRISAVEADALRSRVTVDGEELTLSGTTFETRFAGDGGLLDLRDATGARLIWTVAAERPRPQPVIEGSDDTLLLSPDWNNTNGANSQPTSKPALIQDGTMSPSFVDPFGPKPSTNPTSQPVYKDGTIDPFKASTSQPTTSELDPLFLDGAGGDLPPPKRRGDKPKEEVKTGAGGDLPPPKRRGEEPKSEKKGELPGPKKHGSKEPAPKPVKTNPTPVVKTNNPKVAPVSVVSTSPAIAAIALPMPAIGAPVAALPAGTATTQPVEKPSAVYASFGKEALDDSAKLAARDAALRAKGIDPETYLERKDEAVEASNVTVLLPKEGVTIRGNRLMIQGDTDPKNKILINGQAVPVDDNGHFLAKIELDPGDTELILTATDKEGNVAEVKRPIRVDPSSYFVLALADVSMGDVEAQNFNEEVVHNSAQVGPLFMQGRAALYFKGHVKGKLLFDAYNVTAHIDTARRNDFQVFIDNVIDPEKYYPVYGDSSLEVKEAQARGPIFVMVEADESKLKIGNLQSTLQGVELFRYERTMYGVEVDFKKPTDKDKTMTSEVKIFASADDRSLRRVHNVFRGTGGSVYTLSSDELLEGAERARIVIRDPVSGISLTEIQLERYNDYTVDYRSGRLTMRNPLPSVVDSGFLIDHPGVGASPLGGAPVFLEVDFESEANDFTQSRAGGAYARQSFAKNKISVGAGFVQETRSDAAAYQLFGADIQAKWAEKTFLKAEYAGSAAQDALTFASPDGGLTFATVGLDNPDAARGSAFKISGSFESADFTKKKDKDGKPVETFGAAAYFQSIDGEFSANGMLFDQGYNKSGFSARWKVGPDAKVTARVDSSQFSALVDSGNGPENDIFTNTIGSLGFTKKYTKNTVLSELAYLYSNDGSNDSDPLKRTSILGGVERKVNDRWTLLLSQEAVLAASGSSDLLAPRPPGLSTSPLGNALGQTADGRFLDGEINSTGERLTTSVGARYKLSDDLSLALVESLRWDGSNATSFTLRTKLSDSMSAYATERFQTTEGEMVSSTIVGAEQKLGLNGRTYGEYQLDSAIAGETQRAVMGIGKKWKLKNGLAVSGAYEHAQIFGNVTGPLSRDALAGSAEWLIKKNLKASGKLELRYDNGDNAEGGVDRVQSLAQAAITYRLTPDWTLFARALNDSTQNVTTDTAEVFNRLATFGFAYRPELSDKFNMLGKLSLLSRQVATDLTTNRFDQTNLVAFSIAPVYELNARFGLAGKLAIRSENRAFEDLTPQQITTMLIAARLNVHFSAQWDLGIELLARNQSGALNASQSGFLLEAAYRISKYVSLGAGYNFASFSDDELILDDRNAGGFFLRATGQY